MPHQLLAITVLQVASLSYQHLLVMMMTIAEVKACRNFTPRRLWTSGCMTAIQREASSKHHSWNILSTILHEGLSGGASHSFTFLSLLAVARTTAFLLSAGNRRVHTNNALKIIHKRNKAHPKQIQ